MAAKVREVADSLPLNTLVDLVRAVKERQDLKGFHAFEAVYDILEETPMGWRAAPTAANILERVLAARTSTAQLLPRLDLTGALGVTVGSPEGRSDLRTIGIGRGELLLQLVVNYEEMNELIDILIEALDDWDEETKGDSDEGG